MSLVVTGTVSRINEREAGNPGNTWMEHTLVVEDWGQTQFVTAGRELTEAGLPQPGQIVALVCAVRAYVGRTGEAKAGLTALRSHPQLTEALNAKGVRAAS